MDCKKDRILEKERGYCKLLSDGNKIDYGPIILFP